MGASSCPSSGGTLEKRPAGAEQKRKAERIRGTVHENDKNKRMSHVQDEMVRRHHDEQELFCLEGIQDTREARIVRVDAAGGRAESCAVGIATGERGGKVVALVDVRRANFSPARRKVFVELPPEDYQAGDERLVMGQ